MEITGSHILVFPYPAQGHMLSLLDLTHQLALRGLFITLLTTPKNLCSLTTLLSAHPTTVTALVLPLPPHPSIPPGIENAKDLPDGGFKELMVALGDLYNPLLEWFHNHPTPPTAIIADMFLGWTYRLTCQLGIRHYTYSPTCTFSLAVIYYLWRYQPKLDDPSDENELITFPKIPNTPKFHWWQLSQVYRSYVEGDPTMEFIKDGLLATMASWGIIINSFTEIERVYVDYLKEELGHDRVFMVGPLLPRDNKTIERGGSSSKEVLSWLDKCANQTVLYICFGSQGVLTNGQMEAVALGLEKSEVKFVWSVKEPTAGHMAGEYGRIPDGFEDRVAGRGFMIRGWAPQVGILSHDSVGVFFTHCGWNPITEGLTADVLMLTWPMVADQHACAALLHELKVGIKACEGAKTVPDSDELAGLFRKSVGFDAQGERARAKKLGRASLFFYFGLKNRLRASQSTGNRNGASAYDIPLHLTQWSLEEASGGHGDLQQWRNQGIGAKNRRGAPPIFENRGNDIGILNDTLIHHY